MMLASGGDSGEVTELVVMSYEVEVVPYVRYT
jgi:hypothetical protein